MRTGSGPGAIGRTGEPKLQHFLHLNGLHISRRQTLSDNREYVIRWMQVQNINHGFGRRKVEGKRSLLFLRDKIGQYITVR